MPFNVVIPARYASTRFPGKPLALIKGKPMIQHVHQRAIESGAEKVFVATDDKRIEDTCLSFGADVVMTDSQHENGTARIAEVVEKKSIDDEQIIINVQGDEPFIPPENIKQLAAMLDNNPNTQMSTLCHKIHDKDEVFNPNVVKVVMDESGHALYFSRSVIPYPRDFIKEGKLTCELSELPFAFYRHIGIYGYRAKFIKTYKALGDTTLSRYESLEQLRVLEKGYKIAVQASKVAPPQGVDTPEDLEKLKD